MNKLVRGILAAVFATLISFAAAAPALAAPASLEKIDVTMHDDSGNAVVIVTGYLAEKAPLPATVELAVPTGGEFQWAGEILGGDPSADPAVEYTVKKSGETDVYTFTLTKARTGQLEVSLPAALTRDGSTYRSALAYTPATDVPQVSLYARVPNGTQVTEPAKEAGMTEGPPGFSYYTRVAKDVKAGTPLDLVFAYTAPAAATTPGSAGATAPASNNTLPTVLIVAFAVGALALVVIGVRAKMAAGAAEPSSAPHTPAEKARSRAAADDDAEDFAVDDAAPARRASKAPFIIAVVVIGIVIAGFIAADSGTSTQQFEGKFTRDFGNQSACGTKQLPLALGESGDPEAAAEKVFASLTGLQGLGKVTVDVAAQSVDIGFCESQVSEEQIQGALATAGVLGQGPAPAPATEASATP